MVSSLIALSGFHHYSNVEHYCQFCSNSRLLDFGSFWIYSHFPYLYSAAEARKMFPRPVITLHQNVGDFRFSLSMVIIYPPPVNS